MSDALQALYEGDVEKANAALPAEEELSVFEAAAFGRTARLRSILESAPSQATAVADDGFTALHLAVYGEQAEAAQLLIDHGADVDARSSGSIARVPPLGTAAFVRSLQLARLLLDAGADVNGQGDGGFTALHSAAMNGDAELVELLLERGADATIENTKGKRPADLASSDRVRALLGG